MQDYAHDTFAARRAYMPTQEKKKKKKKKNKEKYQIWADTWPSA